LDQFRGLADKRGLLFGEPLPAYHGSIKPGPLPRHMPMQETVSDEPRRILLVDCDAFFVQVACLEDPHGAGQAELLIVGGSSEGRGVVTSASYACRAMGVRSAMPTSQALRLCPEAMVVPVSRAACKARSEAIRAVLLELAPVVEAASIDEFYLDFTGTERMLHGETLEQTAQRVQSRVFEATKIRVSIGGGTNRLIAKLASSRAKPNGVFVVPPGGEAEFTAKLQLSDLPGVGPTLGASLASKGLTSVRDALALDAKWLREWLGDARAHWLRERMLGRDTSLVGAADGRKSLSSERTFAHDLDSDEELERELLRLCVSVAGSLRREGLRARTLTVKVKDRDFTTRQRSCTFETGPSSDRVFFAEARKLLGDLRKRRHVPMRLLGVSLSGLESDQTPLQLGLFSGPSEGLSGDAGDGRVAVETERDRSLSRAVDDLRSRFGADAIVPGRIAESDPSAKDDGR
jgi:DNA polymerase-4